jgi:hypothetical protein
MLKARQHQEKVRQDKYQRQEIHRKEAHRRVQECQWENEWQYEKEVRQRLRLHQNTLVTDLHCTVHNTCKYKTCLLNTVLYNYNWLKPCKEILIEIHGRSIKMAHCYINPDVRFLIHYQNIKMTTAPRYQVRCMDTGLWILMNPYTVHTGISLRTNYI